MTISSTTIKNSYSGNGSTTAFAYTFPINTTSEITVIERSATGTENIFEFNRVFAQHSYI